MSEQRSEKIKQNIKVHLSYVGDFFRRDEKNTHVHYVSFLSNVSLYIFAFLLAILMYVDYLYTEHFEKVGEVIAQIP